MHKNMKRRNYGNFNIDCRGISVIFAVADPENPEIREYDACYRWRKDRENDNVRLVGNPAILAAAPKVPDLQ